MSHPSKTHTHVRCYTHSLAHLNLLRENVVTKRWQGRLIQSGTATSSLTWRRMPGRMEDAHSRGWFELWNWTGEIFLPGIGGQGPLNPPLPSPPFLGSVVMFGLACFTRDGTRYQKSRVSPHVGEEAQRATRPVCVCDGRPRPRPQPMRTHPPVK